MHAAKDQSTKKNEALKINKPPVKPKLMYKANGGGLREG